MEEKAKIFFKEVWLRPPKDPIILEVIIKKIKILLLISVVIKRGIIFWKVNNKKNGKKFKPSEIWGNHIWKGAEPSLIIMEIIIIKTNMSVEKRKVKNDEKRNNEDEDDWII